MLKVGILFGGKSIEREVSLNSGRTVCDHLDSQYFKSVPLFQSALGDLYLLPWSFLYRGKISDFEHRLEKEAEKIEWDDLPVLIDFMYIAVHGKFAEDGRLQAILELFKIPYLGSKVFGSAISMNKDLHNDFLKEAVEIPRGIYLSLQDILSYDSEMTLQRMHEASLRFPVIVKPEGEGSSFGVFVVHHEKKLKEAVLASSFISGSVGQGVLIEEKINGMEFSCIIITDHKTGELLPLPPTEVRLQKNAEIFDYEQKYMPGAAYEQTPPTSCTKDNIKKIQDTCVTAMKALQLSNMARFDGFLTKDGRVIIIDSNPLSGMGPATFLFRQAAELEMSHAELINCLIKAELKNYHMEKEITVSKNNKKMRVAVLFGGASHEKEISFESGRNVCYKLSGEKYEVIPIFVDRLMKLYQLNNRLLAHNSTREIEAHLNDTYPLTWTSLKDRVDFVFLGLHGGQGENGVVQGTLEMLEIPYNGPSVFTSALCIDKYQTAQFLRKKGFDVPAGLLLSKQEWFDKQDVFIGLIEQMISYPFIVKPHNDGCSVMVSLVHNRQELQDALQVVFNDKLFALIEEKIFGMELTVGVIGNDQPRALMPSEVISSKAILSMEEKFLPGAGENQTPARLSGEDILFVQKNIVDAFKAIRGSGYARIDCFFQNKEQSPTGNKRLVILECNTLPALTPATCLFHQAAEDGLRPLDLLEEIIQLGLEKHKKNEVMLVDKILESQRKVSLQQK
ncbi:ATP-grasp domain-containing protein [Candidatus Dependentiae bacterium]|nr:ATP-grasp domain-containing protein [Candidatus Dependentiae bacterium]